MASDNLTSTKPSTITKRKHTTSDSDNTTNTTFTKKLHAAVDADVDTSDSDSSFDMDQLTPSTIKALLKEVHGMEVDFDSDSNGLHSAYNSDD